MYVDIYEKINSTSVHCNVPIYRYHIFRVYEVTGSFPIDSIFVSPQLQNITRGGWIKIEDSVGDHRALFIDLPTKTLLGEEPFQIHKHCAINLL